MSVSWCRFYWWFRGRLYTNSSCSFLDLQMCSFKVMIWKMRGAIGCKVNSLILSRLQLRVLQCCRNHCHPTCNTPLAAHVVRIFCQGALSLLIFSLSRSKTLRLKDWGKKQACNGAQFNRTTQCVTTHSQSAHLAESQLHFRHCLLRLTNQSIHHCMRSCVMGMHEFDMYFDKEKRRKRTLMAPCIVQSWHFCHSVC